MSWASGARIGFLTSLIIHRLSAPGNYEIFRELMRGQGLLEKDKQFSNGIWAVSGGLLQGGNRSESADAGTAGFSFWTCMITWGRERRWWACCMRSGRKRALSPPNSGAILQHDPCRWCDEDADIYERPVVEIDIQIAHYGPAAD
jgi:hypothetical protein